MNIYPPSDGSGFDEISSRNNWVTIYGFYDCIAFGPPSDEIEERGNCYEYYEWSSNVPCDPNGSNTGSGIGSGAGGYGNGGGGGGNTPTNNMILSNYIQDCQAVMAANEPGGIPPDEVPNANNPAVLQQCEDFFTVINNLNLSEADKIWLINEGNNLIHIIAMMINNENVNQDALLAWIDHKQGEGPHLVFRAFEKRYGIVESLAAEHNLSSSEASELFENVLEFESVYVIPSTTEDFEFLAETAIENDCLNSGNFELCVSEQVFIVEEGGGTTIGGANALATAIKDCFNTTSNTGGNIMHSITLYIDQPKANSTSYWRKPDDVGHAFIGLGQTDVGNTDEMMFGFYPFPIAHPGKETAPGIFKSNSGDQYDVSISFEISGEQFNDLVEEIENGVLLWSVYDLNFNNCTDFAKWACEKTGISTPHGLSFVPRFTFPTGPAPTQNPGKLGENVRDLPSQPNEIGRDTNTGFAPEDECN